MRVAKWGNSLKVRLPAAVVEALELREGDEIESHVAVARQFGVARKPGREKFLKRLQPFAVGFPLISSSIATRRMPAIGRIDVLIASREDYMRLNFRAARERIYLNAGGEAPLFFGLVSIFC